MLLSYVLLGSKIHFLNVKDFLGTAVVALCLFFGGGGIKKKPSTSCSANESQMILSPSVCGRDSHYLHGADTNGQSRASSSHRGACSVHLLPLESIRNARGAES